MSNVLEQPATNITPDACIQVVEDVFEPDPNAGRRYTPNYRTLCSIFPTALEWSEMHAGRRRTYSMPAVEKGKYALLRVYDTWTKTRNFNAEDNQGGSEVYQRSPISCEGIAQDLIRAWAQDAPGNRGGSQPGIMVIAGDKPTQGELDHLWAMQTEYFRYLVMMADNYWITGKREYITDDHRRALRWLGSEDREWFKRINSVLYKKCPNCAEEINEEALGCKHCNVNLLKFYRDAGFKDDEVTPEMDAAVAVFYAARKARVTENNKKVREEHFAGKGQETA